MLGNVGASAAFIIDFDLKIDSKHGLVGLIGHEDDVSIDSVGDDL